MDKNWELIKRLENGLFAELSIYYWFLRRELHYIEAILVGLDKTIDTELFDTIVTHIEILMLNSKNEDGSNEFRYSNLLIEAINVASKHKEYIEYVNQLFYSTNDMVRLYCYANLPLSNTVRELLKKENNAEIKRIVSIRDTFEYIWNTSVDARAKERITRFTKMCEIRAIAETLLPPTKTRDYNIDNRFEQRFFSCGLFENDVEIIIDRVCSFIEDKRIIAYILNQMYENGELKFKEGVRLPEYFEINGLNKNIKARRKEKNDVDIASVIYKV